MFRFIPCALIAAVVVPVFAQSTPSANLRGLVTDSAGAPVASAAVKLEGLGLTTTTGTDGRFTLTNSSAVLPAKPQAAFARIHEGALSLTLAGKSQVLVSVFDPDGQEVASLRRDLEAGSYSLPLPALGNGVRFLHVKAGGDEALVRAVAVGGALRGADGQAGQAVPAALAASLAKRAAALYDVVSVTKSGFQKAYVNIANSDSANVNIKMLKESTAKFSFFVTSMRGLQDLSKNEKCFGGDLRFGETGPGAGLRGADKICATLAEKSMPGSSVNGAFLSVTADAAGKQVNAIDRIGAGPWYDRNGRTLAPTKTDLLAVRPQKGDPTIQNDLPNETGNPNHRPDPNAAQEDNHHTITGSDTTGRLKSATSTCKDWTTADGASANGKPSAGFCWPRNLGGGGGGFGGSHWMSTWEAPGCAPGIDINGQSLGGNPGDTFIGSGGGYGGFYCFALNP